MSARLKSTRPQPPSGGRANQTLRNRGGAFKPVAGTQRCNRGPAPADQGPAGGAGTLDGYGLDPGHDPVQRHGTAIGQHLAGDLPQPDQTLVFDDTNEAIEFVEVLREVRDLDGWTILAWCLMGNHYHLVVKTRNLDL